MFRTFRAALLAAVPAVLLAMALPTAVQAAPFSAEPAPFAAEPAPFPASEQTAEPAVGQPPSSEAAAQLSLYDFSPIDFALSQTGARLSVADLARRAVTGTLDLSPAALARGAAGLFLGELRDSGRLMRGLLVVALLSAFLSCLTESFKSRASGELGFYVCYILLLALLMASFQIAAVTVRGLITSLCAIMEAALPLIVSLLVLSGSMAGAYAFHPLLVVFINAVMFFVRDFLTPFITLTVGAELINSISQKAILTKFVALLKSACTWGLKATAFVFLAALSLQRLASPLASGLAARAAKAAVGAVPVVGPVITGAADMVTYWAGVSKSGVMLAVTIAIVAVCAAPAAKVLILALVYKFTAAAVQPICDARVARCIDAAGSYTLLLLGAGVTVCAAFVAAALMVMSF